MNGEFAKHTFGAAPGASMPYGPAGATGPSDAGATPYARYDTNSPSDAGDTPYAPYNTNAPSDTAGGTPYAPYGTNASSDTADRSAQENDPMQLSLFGEGVFPGDVGGWNNAEGTGDVVSRGDAGRQGDIVGRGDIVGLGDAEGQGDIAGALPPPSVSERDGLPKVPGARKRKKITSVLKAFFCLSSFTAYICAGFLVADTVIGHSAALFASELMAPAETVASDDADTVAVIPAIKPAESEAPSAEEPPASTSHPVEGANMAAHDPFSIANQTKYTPDIPALTSAEAFAASKPGIAGDAAGEPLVLVVHTHATESFLPEGVTEYNDDTSFRSGDVSENMIAVGEELCRALGDAGISALHCTEMFDEESFIHSYEKSAAAVSEYLKAHPSIRYVLDVHRDAIFRQDSTLLAARSTDGSAQVMLVCGTNEMGADFPDWQDNLSFAFSIQAAAKSVYPDLMRNVNLRGASFNQQLAERFLLVEIGSAGNTLSEAKTAARRFAEVFASVVNG